MSKKYAVLHTFNIYRSPRIVKWLIFIHLLSLLATFLCALAIAYKLVISIVLAMSFYFYFKQLNNFTVLRFAKLSGWEIANSTLSFQAIIILGSTVINKFLIVLHYKMQNNQKRTMLISRDALLNDDFRVLLVDLKISGIGMDGK